MLFMSAASFSIHTTAPAHTHMHTHTHMHAHAYAYAHTPTLTHTISSQFRASTHYLITVLHLSTNWVWLRTHHICPPAAFSICRGRASLPNAHVYFTTFCLLNVRAFFCLFVFLRRYVCVSVGAHVKFDFLLAKRSKCLFFLGVCVNLFIQFSTLLWICLRILVCVCVLCKTRGRAGNHFLMRATNGV